MIVIEMQFKTDEVEGLITDLESVGKMTDEINLSVSQEGIRGDFSERYAQSCGKINIPDSRFVELKADKEEMLGLNMTNLLNVLKRFSKEESLTIESNGGKLVMTSHDSQAKRTITIPLIEGIETEMPNLSEIENGFTIKINVSTREIYDILQSAKSMKAERVVFEGRNGSVFLRIDGEGTAERAKISKFEGQDFMSGYAVEYLAKIFTAKKNRRYPNVSLSMANLYPIKIEFGDSLKFYLAPKIDEDEDKIKTASKEKTIEPPTKPDIKAEPKPKAVSKPKVVKGDSPKLRERVKKKTEPMKAKQPTKEDFIGVVDAAGGAAEFYGCNKCECVFPSIRSLKNHLAREHDIRAKSIVFQVWDAR